MDATTRRNVRERAGHRCEYCHLPQAASPFLSFHIDHVLATQHVDDDTESNLALACPHCNFHKGPNLSSVDHQTGGIVELFNPRQHAWDEHFRLNGIRIVGETATGRVTVSLLKMNAPDQQQIRNELLIRNEFD